MNDVFMDLLQNNGLELQTAKINASIQGAAVATLSNNERLGLINSLDLRLDT